MVNATNILITIDKYLVGIGSTASTIIAIIGNSFVFYILTRPKFLKEAIFRYFLCSVIVSTLELVLLWAYSLPKLLQWSFPKLFCQIFTYLSFFLYDLYSWVSAINSIDRVFSLKYGSKFKFLKKFKYQALGIASISAILSLTNIPHFIYDDLSNITLCTIKDMQIGFYIILSNLILSAILPFLTMLFSTLLIIHHLITQKKILYHHKIIDYKREKNFIKSILIMDLWLLTSYFPLRLLVLLRHTSLLNHISEDVYRLLFHIFGLMVIIEASCNFFVYYFSNKLFKNYFHSIIGYGRK